MKLLLVAPEVAPFTNTSSLAAMVGGLAKALDQLGHDVRVVVPQRGNDSSVSACEFFLPDTSVRVYQIDMSTERTPPFFAKSVLSLLTQLSWQPHVIHLHDWQTALLAASLRDGSAASHFFHGTAIVYTVHHFAAELAANADLVKAGLCYADGITTVSHHYAKEMQNGLYQGALAEVIQKRRLDLQGITSGLDRGVWSPDKDEALYRRYTPRLASLKLENKKYVQQEHGLLVSAKVPLLAMVGRLIPETGIDLLLEIKDRLMEETPVQVVVLGDGDEPYQKALTAWGEAYPDRVGINIGFDWTLAAQIYAGSDFLLLPAREAPSGIDQLIGFRYGTIPVVRATGGLADVARDYQPETEVGNSFLFYDFSATAFWQALQRALQFYQDRRTFARLQQKVMAYDFSWSAPARAYESVYRRAMVKGGEHVRTFEMGQY